jgi:recombinational DNA repair protein RecR
MLWPLKTTGQFRGYHVLGGKSISIDGIGSQLNITTLVEKVKSGKCD